MVKTIKIIAIALFAVSCSSQPEIKWSQPVMDGSRTGVKAASAENVEQMMGSWKDGVYTAPNGKVFSSGSTPEVARLVIEAQQQMADLKQVIGEASVDMIKESPESNLSNWFGDVMLQEMSGIFGEKLDIAIMNFGGIRVDLPKGEILKDDILSMFPFKNYICYVELKGSSVREIFDYMAAHSWQVVSGARCVVKDKKLFSAEIGSEPLDDNKIYRVGTISFLLNGGDGLNLAKNALKLVMREDIVVSDIMLPYIISQTQAGKSIEYSTDGRIKYID